VPPDAAGSRPADAVDGGLPLLYACAGALTPTGEEEEGAHQRTSEGMAPNIIGLGLLVAGVIFLIMGGVVLWILGVICVLGGVGALWMTWQRKRRAAT
jgi:hypothetical protein